MPDQKVPPEDKNKTIVSRPESLRRIVAQQAASVNPEAVVDAGRNIPWALAQYFNADIDLAQELAARFPQMPLMSLIHLRTQGSKRKIHLATISAQDGAASLRVEVDSLTRVTHFSFQLNAMLVLRFSLSNLSDPDRQHWLDPMKREAGEVAFLWGVQRYRSDYLIAVPQKMYTSLFAFSPLQIEAAARLTSEVSRKFIAWIEPLWAADAPDAESGDKSNW